MFTECQISTCKGVWLAKGINLILYILDSIYSKHYSYRLEYKPKPVRNGRGEKDWKLFGVTIRKLGMVCLTAGKGIEKQTQQKHVLSGFLTLWNLATATSVSTHTSWYFINVTINVHNNG